MIASFIMLIILGSVFLLFVQSRRNYERPRATMAAQEQMMRVVHWLTQDLEETNIQSVRSYPNPQQPGEAPGLALISPRLAGPPLDAGPAQTFPTGAQGVTSYGPNAALPFGSVQWQGFVYYTLVRDPHHPGVGDLVREEGALLANQPAFSSPPFNTHLPLGPDRFHPPSLAVLAKATKRTLAQDVLLPHQTPSAGGPYFTPGVGPLDGFGGFQLGFQADTTGQVVPALPPFQRAGGLVFTPFDDTHNAPAVVVNLALQDVSSSTGKPTVVTFQLHIQPRN
ncbi:MAG TPA: hypothetical protein VGO93_20835 [Candidatus Xenobia bacterium]